MFDQVHVWIPTAWDFYLMSVCPLKFDWVIERKVPEIHKTIPIIIGGHSKNGISWTIDLRQKSFKVGAKLKYDKTNVNKINYICSQ